MIQRALPAVLFVGIALAGCLGQDSEGTGLSDATPGLGPAELVCVGDVCNLQATAYPQSRQANELSIAVNPTNPLNIVASGKDYTPHYAGDCVWDGVYVTQDGGATWHTSNIPGSNWARLNGDAEEPVTEFSKFWCATDPVLAFGPDGTLYWTVMPYQCDAVSGSKTGRGVHPNGGFNDWFWTCSSMYVLVSEDGGDTWPVVREVAIGPRLEHDKQWITVAPNGDVLLCWDRSDQVGDTGTAASQLTPQGDMVCSVSRDKGRTWAEWVPVNPDWTGFLPWVDYGPDNTAWMAALDGAGNILVSRSEDGLTWSDPVTVGTYQDPSPGGEYGWPVLRGHNFRMFALPTIAVDKSDGPYSGSVYVAWFDHAAGEGDVRVTYSRDGQTWSEPSKMGDDDPAQMNDQFMPAISVGPDGTVDLVWYDSRDDPTNYLFSLYYSCSVDGGASWAPDLRVQEAGVDEQHSHHQNGMVFLGDYIDLDSGAGHAYPVFVDTRNGKADAMVAKIARPGANSPS